MDFQKLISTELTPQEYLEATQQEELVRGISRTISDAILSGVEYILENHMLNFRADCCNTKDYELLSYKEDGSYAVRWRNSIIGTVRPPKDVRDFSVAVTHQAPRA